MRKKKAFIIIAAALCTLLVIVMVCFRSRPMISNPKECSIVSVQCRINGELIDIETFDENEIIDVLSVSKVRQSLYGSGTIPENKIGLLVVLQDDQGLCTVILGSENYLTRERGSCRFNVLNSEQVKKELYRILLP